MSKKLKQRPNTKRTGEFAEAAFLTKASSLGFHLAKPWGDSERYDFILDNGQRLLRIQVKCTATLRAAGYDVQSIYTNRTRKARLTADDTDILVAYVIPCNTWYILPPEAFTSTMCLRFYPHRKCRRARFERYREAWELLT